tara:strand:+ start:113 stop:475 length:363 start_codon:yes stop_codon:yes gene_type:complete
MKDPETTLYGHFTTVAEINDYPTRVMADIILATHPTIEPKRLKLHLQYEEKADGKLHFTTVAAVYTVNRKVYFSVGTANAKRKKCPLCHGASDEESYMESFHHAFGRALHFTLQDLGERD